MCTYIRIYMYIHINWPTQHKNSSQIISFQCSSRWMQRCPEGKSGWNGSIYQLPVSRSIWKWTKLKLPVTMTQLFFHAVLHPCSSSSSTTAYNLFCKHLWGPTDDSRRLNLLRSSEATGTHSKRQRVTCRRTTIQPGANTSLHFLHERLGKFQDRCCFYSAKPARGPFEARRYEKRVVPD